MITSIFLENFKGVRNPLKVDLKPVTLLFGANSAGKSTIIQAIHYATEVFTRGNLDPRRTMHGGDVVDLGGFDALVHKHDRGRILRVGVEWVPDWLPSFAFSHAPGLFGAPRAAFDAWLDGIAMGPRRVGVVVGVGWSERLQRPIVRDYEVSLDGEAIATMRATADGRHVTLAAEDVHWPASVRRGADGADVELPWVALEGDPEGVHRARGMFSLANTQRQLGALPDSWGPLLIQEADEVDADEASAFATYRAALDVFLFGSMRDLSNRLEAWRYIGPIREIPSRGFQPHPGVELDRWANGLGAWDALHRDHKLAARTSEWLVRIGTRTRLETRALYLGPAVETPLGRGRPDAARGPGGPPPGVGGPGGPPPGIGGPSAIGRSRSTSGPRRTAASPGSRVADAARGGGPESSRRLGTRVVLVDERSGVEVLPADVGVGLSQVVPVVVATLERDARGLMVVVEQPELHVHPRIQVGLGDLFLACTGADVPPDSAIIAVREKWQARLAKLRESGQPRGEGRQQRLDPETDEAVRHEVQLITSAERVIVETHSEHLLLRLLKRVRKAGERGGAEAGQAMANHIAVYYVDQHPEDGTRIAPIRIDENGEFVDVWPEGFFEERLGELM